MRLYSTCQDVIYFFHLTLCIITSSTYGIFLLMQYNLFNKLPMAGYLDCYKISIIINNIQINIFVKMFVFIHDDLLRISSNRQDFWVEEYAKFCSFWRAFSNYPLERIYGQCIFFLLSLSALGIVGFYLTKLLANYSFVLFSKIL